MNLDFLLSDEDFEREFTNVVLPFISPLKTDISIKTNKGYNLRAAFYKTGKSNSVIFISHGYTENIERYQEIIYYFLKADYSVAIMEHLGHGYSDRILANPCKVHIDTFDTYVDDFHTFYKEIRSRMGDDCKYYLFAHSMGGCIGTLYLEQYPNDFRACVLSSPMHEPDSGGVPKPLCKLAATVLELFGKGEQYLGSQDQDYKPTETFENAAGTSYSRWNTYNEIRKSDERYHTSSGTIHWMHEAILASEKAVRNAGKITTPILLSQAGRDTYVVPAAHNRFVAKCSVAKLITFPDAKHEVFNSDYDTRKRFYQEIFDFLDAR